MGFSRQQEVCSPVRRLQIDAALQQRKMEGNFTEQGLVPYLVAFGLPSIQGAIAEGNLRLLMSADDKGPVVPPLCGVSGARCTAQMLER